MTEIFRQSLFDKQMQYESSCVVIHKGRKEENMKKILLFTAMVLTVACGGAAVWLIFFADAGVREAVQDALLDAWGWIETNVLPQMLSTGTLVGLTSVELIPVVKSFLKSKEAFASVAKEVSDYTAARLEWDIRAEEREKAFYAKMEELRIENDVRLEARDKELLAREAALAHSIEAFSTLASGFEETLLASEGRLAAVLSHIDRNADKTERIVDLAFTHSGELVSKGIAGKISEVAHEDENQATII